MLEVRCCCKAENLLGYLEGDPDKGSEVHCFGSDDLITLPIRTYVEEYEDGDYLRVRAYSADHLGLEQLLMIEGFEEASKRKPKRPPKRPKKRTWEK